MSIEDAIKDMRERYGKLMDIVDYESVRGRLADKERQEAFRIRVNIEHLGGTL